MSARSRGRDFEQEGRSLVFPRPLAQEGRLGFWRWASMWLGIAGTYRKHETVDLVYEADGRREVETGLAPQPYERTQSDAAASSGWSTMSPRSAATASEKTSPRVR